MKKIFALLVTVCMAALTFGFLSSVEDDRAKMLNQKAYEVQAAGVVAGSTDLESAEISISAEKAPKKEKAEESAESTETAPEGMEEPMEDTLPAEAYEELPEESYEDLPTESYEELPEDTEALPEASEEPMEEEVPAEDMEPSQCELVLDFAKEQIGKPYVYGGVGPDAWDSSGLVRASFAQAGIDLPRNSSGQIEGLEEVAQPAACSIAYSPGWVGIVDEDGLIIASTNPKRGVDKGPAFDPETKYFKVLAD